PKRSPAGWGTSRAVRCSPATTAIAWPASGRCSTSAPRSTRSPPTPSTPPVSASSRWPSGCRRSWRDGEARVAAGASMTIEQADEVRVDLGARSYPVLIGAGLLRGLPLVQVPTTLLAQVDAAIGGKTGIDHAHGKNLVGAFHQPRLVLIDVATLRTLPRREFVAGLAEVIKYGMIRDAELFGTLEARLDALLALDEGVLVPVVATSCRHKAAVVAADEREQSGERAVLNFGHTIGHALEVLTEYRGLLHGEAVAIGMVAAARVSRALGVCDTATVERLERLLRRAGLPVAMPADVTAPALALAMQSDKKTAGGRIRFV